MKVLITGVAGFLGSNLAQRHLSMGDTVWGVDNFVSSSPKSAHFATLRDNNEFVFKEHDINDPLSFEATSLGLWNQRFDVIYNFACPASPPRYQEIPIFTTMTCVAGTANVLQRAQRDGAIIIHASTSEVYGDPTTSPQRETYIGNVNPYGPRSCYDEGKRAAEALCYDFRNTYEVDARLVRIFNTYGPNMDPDDGRVVTNFVKQALKGDRLTIYGSGLQTRSFCYVDDLIDGITRMAQLPHNPGTPINIGNPTEFTMLELASAVLREVHGPDLEGNDEEGIPNSCIEFMPLPKDDPTQRRPDITLANNLLGWEPKVQLRDGLRKMVPYMRSVLGL